MIWIGTSGFQYPEWKGSFYPEKLLNARMLSFYAQHFATTEINYSFYRIPSAKTLVSWNSATPEKFYFSFKAPKEITHIRRLQNADDALRRFLEAITELNQKLGAVLFQMPPFFKKNLSVLESFLVSLPRNLNVAFEFRHASWFADDVFSCLKSHNAALCVAESEKLVSPIVFTGRFGYFRLRRTDYTQKDIARWASVIAGEHSHFKDIYVYFKHA
jgi:uncharacterized protein YecE (DUF72 family)